MAQYRLQTLLEIREREEEAAKQAFSEATRALRQEQELQMALEDELEAMIQDRYRRREEYAR